MPLGTSQTGEAYAMPHTGYVLQDIFQIVSKNQFFSVHSDVVAGLLCRLYFCHVMLYLGVVYAFGHI